MQKAKSRIKTNKPSKVKTKDRKSRLSLGLTKRYLKHLPLLFLSMPFYAGAYYIFTNIHPAQIQHFAIANTYLPLQLTFFLGNFFLFSYLFLKTRRGVEISLLIGFTLFLKLQLITNYLPTAMGLLIVILIAETSISLFKKN